MRIEHNKDSECMECKKISVYSLIIGENKIILCDECKHDLSVKLLLATENIIHND